MSKSDGKAPRTGKRVLKRGGLQLTWKDGKAVWTHYPIETETRQATKKEAREIMKQAREGLGLVTTGKRRRSA